MEQNPGKDWAYNSVGHAIYSDIYHTEQYLPIVLIRILSSHSTPTNDDITVRIKNNLGL